MKSFQETAKVVPSKSFPVHRHKMLFIFVFICLFNWSAPCVEKGGLRLGLNPCGEIMQFP